MYSIINMSYSRSLRLIHLVLLKPCTNTSPLTLPLAPSNHPSLCFYEFNYYRFFIEWDHAVFVFMGLASLTQPNILQVYPCCHKWKNILLILGPNNIAFCVHTAFSLSMHLSINIEIAFMSWLSCSELGRADSDYNSFRYIPRRGVVGLYSSSIFNFWRTSFSRWLADLRSHQQCTWISLLSTSLPTLVIFCSFVSVFWSHPSWCEMVLLCDLHLYFLDNYLCCIPFHILC